MKVFIGLVLAFTASAAKDLQFLTDVFIRSINQKQSTWVAGRNFPEDTPLEQLRRLGGALFEETQDLPAKKRKIHPRSSGAIPETFDAREEWPYCESLKTIRDQGSCGLGWAFAALHVMSDRLCIATEGKVQFEFSPEDILECCNCGGCEGGTAASAFEYWVKQGIVSGGDLSSEEGCKPYEISGESLEQPQCTQSCQNQNYPTSYEDDKHFGASYDYVPGEMEQMQIEIMTNGPITTRFNMYDDFFAYDSGVYQQTTDNGTGLHFVKILGWGVENDTPYWLLANSWGEAWGGLKGFFKFLRGQDHCNIEQLITVGVPRL